MSIKDWAASSREKDPHAPPKASPDAVSRDAGDRLRAKAREKFGSKVGDVNVISATRATVTDQRGNKLGEVTI
jgi:hypothetical protein